MPAKPLYLLLACLLCLQALTGFGQAYRFDNYTTRDGLVSDEIYSMRQDKQGYIWLFTNFGAQKFDGSTFKPVLRNLLQEDNFIYSSYERPDGRMWLANSKAIIYEVRHDSAFVVRGIDSVSTLLRKAISEIFQVYVDDSLNISLASKMRCYKLQKTVRGYRTLALEDDFDEQTVGYGITVNKGLAFSAFSGSRHSSGYFFNQDSIVVEVLWGPKRTRYKIKSSAITGPGFVQQANGNIYCTFDKNVIRMNADGSYATLKCNSRVQNFAVDGNGHVWIGCLNDGLYEFGADNVLLGHYLKSLTVNHVLIDTQHGLWASTSGEGLFHCANLNILHYREPDTLGAPLAFIKLLARRQLAVVNTHGNIFIIDSSGTHAYTNYHPGSTPTDLIEMNKKLVLSYRDKILQQDGDGISYITYRGVVPISAVKLGVLGPDTILGVTRKGIIYMVNGTFSQRFDFDYKMYAAMRWHGGVFLCTDEGIALFSNGKISEPAFLRATSNMSVRGVVPDSHNRLWFYTQGHGLFVLDAQMRLTHLTQASGLPADIIYNLSFTDNDKMLLSTNSGLFMASYPVNAATAEWKNIYPGAVTNAIDLNGKIYLHTRGHLAVLDPLQKGHLPVYYFNFAGLLVNTIITDSLKLSHLEHYENNVQFNFELVTFTKVKPVVKYSLTGPVTDAGFGNDYMLKFGNLPPGHYQLTVAPAVKNGGSLRLVIPFVIYAAFYQTTWFKVIMGLLLIAAVTLVVWLIFRRRKKNQDIRTNAHRLILEYRLIALKAQINPHFMSNCLASIQNLVISNKLLQATSYISKFGLLVRQILNFSSRSLVTLQEELDVARLYVELEQLRFEHRFTFDITVEQGIDASSQFVPALILNPIIENAIWHGVSALPPQVPGKISIHVYRNDDSLFMAVSDNGPGIDRTENKSGRRQSKGIHLTEQRLRNINFLYGISSAELRYERHSAPSGTTALISLPANLEPINNE